LVEGRRSMIARRTPMALARVSQAREWAAGLALGLGGGLVGLGLTDPPIVHLDETIAAGGEGAVMSGHDEGDAFGGGDVEEQLKDGGAGGFVEGAGGLVGEQDAGVVHEGAAEGGALALATGELLDAVVEAVAEAGAVGELFEAGLGGGVADAGGDGGDEAVFFEGEIGDEVVELEDEADFVAQEMEAAAMAVELDAVDRDAAAVGLVETAEEMEEGALAAAGGSAESDGLACDGFEVHALEDGDGTIVVALPDFGGAEDDGGLGGFGVGRSHSKRSASTARMRMA
jgi:hypothetical protein